jgi:hypothetical protein
LSFSYDGLGKANGVNLYVNGSKIKNEVLLDNLYKSIKPVVWSWVKQEKRELKIGVSRDYFTGDNKIFKGLIDDIIVYNRSLTDYEIGLIYNQYNINKRLNFTDSQKKNHLMPHWMAPVRPHQTIKNGYLEV